jgi:probable F420-dependent oxidoreductase
MDFGFTLKPEHSIDRTIALTKQAEAAGFGYGWLFDSHILWKDVYPLLTLMAVNTERMRLGTCVTNPATRDITVTASALATLNEISDGRMDLGIGRGDSAQRVLGRGPVKTRVLDKAVGVIKDLVEGRTTSYMDAGELSLSYNGVVWTEGYDLPVWIAGYGPMVLGMAGRTADGVILQLADVDLIKWMIGIMRGAAEVAGRDSSEIRVQAAAPAHVGPIDECREHVRWFPALVSNHVVDLVNKYPREELPESLTGYIRDREGYDYQHHATVGSDNAGFVADEVADRFSIVGPPEEHVRRLLELHEAGVDQFNLYLMNGDEEAQLEAYGKHVIPAFRKAIGEA